MSTSDSIIALLFWLFTAVRTFTAVLELFLWYSVKSEACGDEAAGDQSCPTTFRDVTVVCATHNTDLSIMRALGSWLENGPNELIIVASPRSFEWTRQLCSDIKATVPITILRASLANKRVQLCHGIRAVKTSVTVLVDDDTEWSNGILGKLVRPLLRSNIDSPRLGCVFPDLRLRTTDKSQTMWTRLALLRHAAAGVNLHGNHALDGGTYCHHGPTSVYKTSILQDTAFQEAFQTETFCGVVRNDADDQFLARWLQLKGWGTHFLPKHEGFVLTSTKDDWKLLKQLLRWSRGDWCSNLSALLWERQIWRSYPYTAFVRLWWCLDTLQPFIDFSYLWNNLRLDSCSLALVAIFFSHVLLAIPQALEDFSLLPMLPVYVIYHYAHSIIKLYAICTLNKTSWL